MRNILLLHKYFIFLAGFDSIPIVSVGTLSVSSFDCTGSRRIVPPAFNAAYIRAIISRAISQNSSRRDRTVSPTCPSKGTVSYKYFINIFLLNKIAPN
jgi:hypothetical protein